MKLGKALQKFAEDAKNTDSYWVEKAKLDFSIGLERQRARAKMTYAAVAKAIDSSAAYITKVFRGDTNVTIETMVKLARATGGQLEIQIVSASRAQLYRSPGAQPKRVGSHTTASTAIVLDFDSAANSERFRDRYRFAAA